MTYLSVRRGEIGVGEFELIKKVINEQLGIDENSITLETSFVDDLGADSLDIVELIMGFETEFDIEIPDDKEPARGVVCPAAADSGYGSGLRETGRNAGLQYLYHKQGRK